jgi:ribosomal protein S18 acetylase RimI-like enzyme
MSESQIIDQTDYPLTAQSLTEKLLTTTYHLNPDVTNDELNALFAAAWPGHISSDFGPVLSRSLAYICAYEDEQLVGFVNLAWDGGIHAFVLDTSVHPNFQRRGIGRQLIKYAADAAKARHIEWLHVDYRAVQF